MPLTCGCEGFQDFDWYYERPSDYSEMPPLRRRKRCSSCGEMINAGALAAEFKRTRPARGDVEERIYGEGHDAINLAPLYLCEECADLWFSLDALGFCVSPDEDQRDLARDYAAMGAAGGEHKAAQEGA